MCVRFFEQKCRSRADAGEGSWDSLRGGSPDLDQPPGAGGGGEEKPSREPESLQAIPMVCGREQG